MGRAVDPHSFFTDWEMLENSTSKNKILPNSKTIPTDGSLLGPDPDPGGK